MGFFDENEKVEEIMNVDVEVKTDKGNIKTIRFKDFKKSIDNSISIHKDDSKSPQYDIVIKLNCNGYNVGIDGWISAKDKLPKDREVVLIQGSTGRMYVGYGDFDGTQWYIKTSPRSHVNGIKPVAWRLLPDKYNPEDTCNE